jgi:hypothetical protein
MLNKYFKKIQKYRKKYPKSYFTGLDCMVVNEWKKIVLIENKHLTSSHPRQVAKCWFYVLNMLGVLMSVLYTAYSVYKLTNFWLEDFLGIFFPLPWIPSEREDRYLKQERPEQELTATKFNLRWRYFWVALLFLDQSYNFFIIRSTYYLDLKHDYLM